MIKKIVLENFLSYDNVTVEFSGSTLAVVGDNGVGKSAFLESIPYAYYGIGREDKAGMSRIHGDGSHRVEIWDDDDVRIIRGRKANGSGFTEVRSGDTLLAKGGDADAWISNHLGMNADTFMLTAFFGLGDSYTDKLLHVLPAARLEALQELAKVGPYKDFLSKSKAMYSSAETTYNMEKARKDGAETSLVEVSSLSDRMSECNKIVRDSEATLDVLRKERATLQEEEAVYHEFVKEKERLSVERKMLSDTIDECNSDIESFSDQVKSDTEDIQKANISIKSLTDSLPKIDVQEAKARVESIRYDMAIKKTTSQLKSTAAKLPEGASAICPLCEQSITESVVKSWEESVKVLNSQIESMGKECDSINQSVAKVESIQKSISALKEDVQDSVASITSSQKAIQELKHRIASNSVELKKKDDRFFSLSEKLGGEYQGLRSKIADVLSRMDDCQTNKGQANGEIIQLRDSIRRSEESKKVVAKSLKAMETAWGDMQALNLLKTAWSRYGIPLQLVNRLTSRLEAKATVVYQEFDNGHIDVREVDDRGKPGIQFFLVDRKGERTFGQLSMGEKIMFFISIRVAVAQIISEDSAISVDFLVLDEAMGNLSPKRRDDLVRLINKSLRKIFPQLILVTHTAMPEIFDTTLKVSMQNDVSILQVS